ncbi:MAG: hypothetical protein LBT53_04865 [Puniceicoccales bacterium]|nr:hypothetical protein [Puniceicoccales bacterium]
MELPVSSAAPATQTTKSACCVAALPSALRAHAAGLAVCDTNASTRKKKIRLSNYFRHLPPRPQRRLPSLLAVSPLFRVRFAHTQQT